MSAAILQGVPATTLDTDLWLDLPPRQSIRVLISVATSSPQFALIPWLI